MLIMNKINMIITNKFLNKYINKYIMTNTNFKCYNPNIKVY